MRERKRKTYFVWAVLVLILILPAFLMVSCGQSKAEKGMKESFLGEHSLFQFPSGEYVNIVKTTLQTQFIWSPRPGSTIRTVLPDVKVEFVTDETKTKPTVEFFFRSDWPKKEDIENFKNTRANFNDYLQPNDLTLVVIKASSAILEKEIYCKDVR